MAEKEVICGPVAPEPAEDLARNWLALDGSWFQAIEMRLGTETAVECDRDMWRLYGPSEARRIMKRHAINPGSGLEGLKEVLRRRVYSSLVPTDIVEETERSFVWRILDCRPLALRRAKGMSDFDCASVGIVEYTGFAETVDPRIQTELVACPKDPHAPGFSCAWRFRLREDWEERLT